MPAAGRCALLASWPRPPLARSAAAPPRDGRALPDMVLPDMVLPDMVLPDMVLPDMVLPDMVLPDMVLPDMVLPDMVLPDGPRGNTSPCELLAVACGVILHEALDELIDRAGP